MRRLFMTAIFMFNALLVTSAYAQVGVLAPPEPQAGKEYTVLPTPVATTDSSKIEVSAAFTYSCPHCYDLDPKLTEWAKNLPADVYLKRIPALATGMRMWNIHAQLFVTLDTLGVEDKLHSAVFKSVRSRKNILVRPEDMANFVAENGVDRAKFLETYESFGVQTKLENYRKLIKAYQINGVPAMVVNGKYLVDVNDNVNTPQDMLRVADYLVKKERAAKTGASSN